MLKPRQGGRKKGGQVCLAQSSCLVVTIQALCVPKFIRSLSGRTGAGRTFWQPVRSDGCIPLWNPADRHFSAKEWVSPQRVVGGAEDGRKVARYRSKRRAARIVKRASRNLSWGRVAP